MSFQSKKSIVNKPKLQPEETQAMNKVTYTVPNISCMHCVHTIKTEVGELAGVQAVDANAETKVVSIQFDPPATEEGIVALLTEINYPPSKN
jgi:copper chaperone CopZ